MKYSETWGDVVWRHNMLCLLGGAAVLILGSLAIFALASGYRSPCCPPEWQCRGTPETNNPNCKCWDNH